MHMLYHNELLCRAMACQLELPILLLLPNLNAWGYCSVCVCANVCVCVSLCMFVRKDGSMSEGCSASAK